MAHRRNPNAKKLRGAIGLVDCYLDYPVWKNKQIETIPWGASILEKAKQYGFSTEIIRLATTSPSRIERALRAQHIAGLIFGPSQNGRIPINLAWECYSTCTVAFVSHDPLLHAALNNDYASTKSVLDIAISLGYKRIGLAINYGLTDIVGEGWLSAFLTEKYLGGHLEWPEPYISKTGANTDFLKWLEVASPELLLCNMRSYLEVALQSGLQMPQDIAWLHLHRVPGNPDIAYFEHNPDALATAVVNLVVGQILRNERGIPRHPMKVLIQDTFRFGKSFPDCHREFLKNK